MSPIHIAAGGSVYNLRIAEAAGQNMQANHSRARNPDARYVEWFRGSAPYINAHRGRTVVVRIDGELLDAPTFPGLIHDVALLDSLGIRVVLVPGTRPQIEERLAARGIHTRTVDGIRLTDAQALEVVKEAAGFVRVEIESQLSMGLPNSPMAGAQIQVASGNYVTARPRGIHDGVDFAYSGEVRRIDGVSIAHELRRGAVVLLLPIGYSPTGETFNLRSADVATAAAIELGAAKLVFLGDAPGVVDSNGELLRQLDLEAAKQELERVRALEPRSDTADHLEHAVRACRLGVKRAHLVDRHVDGALLLELFTRDGVGTMVNADAYDATRRAQIDDVGGILELIEPLEREGILVRRSREKLETEIDRFLVVERDGTVIACAATHPFPEESLVELACLAVHDQYRKGSRGDALLDAVEREARMLGATGLFVLTTRAVHWFKERGFEDAEIDTLPVARRRIYNFARKSKVLVKSL